MPYARNETAESAAADLERGAAGRSIELGLEWAEFE
jgi:hypothetical protein